MRKTAYDFKINTNRTILVDEFLEKKRLCGITISALGDIEGVLRRFFQHYHFELVEETKLKKAVLEFLMNKRADHYNKTMQVLRQFFNHCIEEGVLSNNPCKGLKFKPQATRIVEHGEQILKALIKLPDKGTFVGLRDLAFMLLLLDTGCRPSEALQLRIRDFQDSIIKVRAEIAKTRKERYLPVSLSVIQIIRKLIRARHCQWDNENGYIFCSFSGSRITTRHMQLRFRGYSKELGMNVRPYDLRHSFALMFIRNGGNVFALSRILGHASLTMTQRYVALVEADIKGNHEKASPITMLLAQKHILRKI